jgi:hypothetical protein
MKRLIVASSMVVLVGVLTARVGAEEKDRGRWEAGRHGPPALVLLDQPAIRADLRMTDDQTRAVREALVRQFAAFLEIRELAAAERARKIAELHRASEEAVARILKAEQSARFKQIALQVEGPRAFFNPETARDLGITPEQQEKMRAIHAEARQAFAKACTEGKASPEEAAKTMTVLRRQTSEQIQGILTDAQKARWKEMTGEPVQGEIRLGRFGEHGRHGGCQG